MTRTRDAKLQAPHQYMRPEHGMRLEAGEVRHEAKRLQEPQYVEHLVRKQRFGPKPGCRKGTACLKQPCPAQEKPRLQLWSLHLSTTAGTSMVLNRGISH